MAVRAGMDALITRWRRMVNDADGNVWTTQEAQDILDLVRVDFYQEPLEIQRRQIAPNVVDYRIYRCRYTDLEGTASGTLVWRLYDSTGTSVSSAYTVDYQRGLLTFTYDQAGSTRYLDGRSYDVAAAAAIGWRELMATKASYFDFSTDGQSFSRSQWFKHCELMANHYDGLAKPMSFAPSALTRTDICP